MRIEPISEAILLPTFPANIKLTMVGENSNIIDSLAVKPTAYKGTNGLVKLNAACMVITPPIKKLIIVMSPSELSPMLFTSKKN